MEIRKVIPSGYCKGVVNAIRLAKKTKQDNPDRKVYVLGMLVHNSFVTRELDGLGIITLDDTNKTKEELIDGIDEGIVIFTAHGISDQLKQKVIKKGLDYVDASCVDVLKTQAVIREKLDEGYDVIYFGKKGHPEAEAVLSISDRIHLVANEEDIADLKIDNGRIFLTNQTTMSFMELQDLISAVLSRYPQTLVQKEICNATGSRQEAIGKLTDCDLLYVVGDLKSNNTAKLVDIGRRRGIKKVRLIQTYEDIDTEDLKDIDNVYVTAGASTPPYLIDQVMEYLTAKARDQLADRDIL